MAEQDLIRIARGVVDSFNASDWERCKMALSSDSLYEEVCTSRRLQGVRNIIPGWQGWKEAMPDVKGTVTNICVTGNTVLLEMTWQRAHTVPLQVPSGTGPATGKEQTTRSGWVMKFDGGKIKESRHYFDVLSFMQLLTGASNAREVISFFAS